MSLRKVNYVIAACDACGNLDWWQNTDADRPPHFETPAIARKQLADDYGWRIERRLDGRHKMFCPKCAERGDCELYGCDWPTAGDGDVRLQTCHRCTRVRRADDPPADHPDFSVSALPQWLADLDAELFPEEAI
jgi:hypothetical protein